jgi:hypothetical protein
MISQGQEDIEITSGFGPLRPLMDARWERSTAQNDPIRTLGGQFCCYAQPYLGNPGGSPNVAHGAGARVCLRMRRKLPVELAEQ